MLSKEPIYVKQLKGAQINQPSEKTVLLSGYTTEEAIVLKQIISDTYI